MFDRQRARCDVKNKYMRFWRSLTSYSRNTPKCVLKKYQKLQRDPSRRGRLMVLFEDFSQADEDWQKSTIVQNKLLKRTMQRRGKMVWLTEAQLSTKYQSPLMAEFICKRKSQTGKTKNHPEIPGEQMYLCFDAKEFEDKEAETQHASLNIGTVISRADRDFQVLQGHHLSQFPDVGAVTAGSCSKHSSPGPFAGCWAPIINTDSCSCSCRPRTPRTANKTRKRSSARSRSTSSASSLKKTGSTNTARKAKKKHRKESSSSSSSSSSASSSRRPTKKRRTGTAMKASREHHQGSSSRASSSSSSSEAPTTKVKDRHHRAKHRKVAATVKRRRRSI